MAYEFHGALKLPSGNYGNSPESIDKFCAKAYELNKATLDKFIRGGISRDRFTNRIKTLMAEEQIDKKMAVLKYGNSQAFVTKAERAWHNIRKYWAQKGVTQRMAARLGALDRVTDEDITWNDVEQRYEVRIRARYAGQKDFTIWFDFSDDMYDFMSDNPHWGYVI